MWFFGSSGGGDPLRGPIAAAFRTIRAFATFLAFLALAPAVAAQPGRRPEQGYESRRLAKALAERSLVADSDPEGKRIRFIRLARHNVFQRGEFWPDFFVWFNHLRWLTRERVVERELTFEVGDAYAQTAADETMRNLRALGIFALVRVVPVQTRVPGEVGVLVFTRDLWSLRPETDFAGAGDNLRFVARLTERNFLGNNTSVSARIMYQPITLSVGQSLHDYRLFGQRLELVESADLFYNRQRGRVEGGTVAVRFSRPFYRLSQRFAFDLSVGHRAAVHRDLQGVQAARVDLTNPDSDTCDPAVPGCVLSVYDERVTLAELVGHLRTGIRYKQTWSAGVGAARRHYRSNSESQVGAGFGPAFERRVLPKSRVSVYPLVRYRLTVPDFAYFRDLGTFGTVESVQRGPALDARLLVPLSALGSTHDAFVVHGEAGVTWAAHDALVRASAEVGARLEQGQVRDQSLSLQARAATPSWLLGRLVAKVRFDGLRRDTARSFVSLGWDNGLRGYPAGFERGYGDQRLLMNTEYRSSPVDVLSLQLGAVLFFDSGSVFPAGRRPDLHHGAGAGLRLLIPHFNVDPLRLDVGVPIGAGGFSVLLSYGWDQVVPLTPREDALQENRL